MKKKIITTCWLKKGERMKESELFPPLKNFLEKGGHEIFTEVSVYSGMGSPRADIITKNGACITIIELKKKLNIEVIGQALKWRGKANYVYVAVPYTNANCDYRSREILKNLGIGLMLINEWNNEISDRSEIYITQKPRFYRRICLDWNRILQPYFKGTEAGTNKIAMSKYQYMMQQIRKTMEQWKSNGKELIPITDLLPLAENHYAAPKGSLAAALTKFEQDWIEKIKIGRKIYFRLKEPSY
ncbi:MAG: hypothetical protein ABFD79_18290 [Phycisphaerales bacterium]